MLLHLSIRNIVLIEQVNLQVGPGLCVLSGETGAGKSILLDALGLALGGRAESRLVRRGAEKAVVTAEFSLEGLPYIHEELEGLGLEPGSEDMLVLRRQLDAQGKSRAFINDEPVSAKALKSIGEKLVEVHGQHQQRGLLDPSSHLALLDGFGRHDDLLRRVSDVYAIWNEQTEALKLLQRSIEQTKRERDYLEHMQAELAALNPQPGEEEALSDRRLAMMQAEKMATTLDEVLVELQQPRSVEDALRSAQNILMRSTLKEAEQFSPAIDALEKAMVELQEAQAQVRELGHAMEYDPGELEAVEERLFALKDAGRKYNLPLDELPDLMIQVNEKLALLATQEEQESALSRQVDEARSAYLKQAEKLRQTRRQVAGRLEKALLAELKPLKMEATRFQVAMTPKEEEQYSAQGIDTVQFEVATNKGSDLGPLQQIASGGELSRFMLALAVVLADVHATPCMIFDEIDAGTGGAVADAIGRRLETLGEHAQVMVVTHLPQVAARGNRHYRIEKTAGKCETTTTITQLDTQARQEELARMLSGADITTQARAAAGQLLESHGDAA